MEKILFIEDDSESLFAVQKALENDYEVISCTTLKEAKEQADRQEFNMILLDVSLPDGDGFQFLAHLKNIKKHQEIPSLFISGKSSISDQIVGYTLGAEDYIVKPIHPSVLKAKIASKFKAIERRSETNEIVSVGNLRVHTARQKAWISQEGTQKDLDLTPLEFKILRQLASHVNHVYSRDKLLELIWPEKINVVDRTVDTHMSHVRKKLRTAKSSHNIESVHGVGYRFTEKVKNPATEISPSGAVFKVS